MGPKEKEPEFDNSGQAYEADVDELYGRETEDIEEEEDKEEENDEEEDV